jgi:DNA processing protein
LSPTSAGANTLLRQGAAPVTCADDILEALGAETTPDVHDVARHVPELGPIETSVWHALSHEPRHVDDLVRGLPLPSASISATLAMLEVKGLARQAGPMLYTRA